MERSASPGVVKLRSGDSPRVAAWRAASAPHASVCSPAPTVPRAAQHYDRPRAAAIPLAPATPTLVVSPHIPPPPEPSMITPADDFLIHLTPYPIETVATTD